MLAVDLSHARLALARANAAVYGVADYCEFVCADFLRLAASGRRAARG